MKKNTENQNDLTDEEVAFLKSSSTVPNEAKAYLARQHENLGTKASAYRKVGAAAQAECNMLLSLRDLDEVHGQIVSVELARQSLEGSRKQIAALELQLAQKDAKIIDLTARPALAVHSGDD